MERLVRGGSGTGFADHLQGAPRGAVLDREPVHRRARKRRHVADSVHIFRKHAVQGVLDVDALVAEGAGVRQDELSRPLDRDQWGGTYLDRFGWHNTIVPPDTH